MFCNILSDVSKTVFKLILSLIRVKEDITIQMFLSIALYNLVMVWHDKVSL